MSTTTGDEPTIGSASTFMAAARVKVGNAKELLLAVSPTASTDAIEEDLAEGLSLAIADVGDYFGARATGRQVQILELFVIETRDTLRKLGSSKNRSTDGVTAFGSARKLLDELELYAILSEHVESVRRQASGPIGTDGRELVNNAERVRTSLNAFATEVLKTLQMWKQKSSPGTT